MTSYNDLIFLWINVHLWENFNTHQWIFTPIGESEKSSDFNWQLAVMWTWKLHLYTKSPNYRFASKNGFKKIVKNILVCKMCFRTVHVLFMFYKTKFSVYQSCKDCALKSVEHLHMITHQNQFSLGLWSWYIYISIAYGLSKLTEMFHLCRPLKSMDDVDALKGWIQSALVYLAMVDYPYPSKFLAPLPAWPVKVCILHSTCTYWE